MTNQTRERIARSAGRVSGATILSRVLGLTRDILFAALFGTSLAADAFNVAFLIPNFLRRVFGEGALAASYVPVYSDYLHRQGRQSAARLAGKMFSVMAIVLICVVAFGILFSSPIVKVYAFGWKESPEAISLTVRLTRILFPYIFFVGLASVAAGTLNSLGYFTIPALAPVFLNISFIITGAMLMYFPLGSTEKTVVVFAIGAVVGGLLQLLIQIPKLLKTGHSFTIDPDFRDRGVRWIGSLLLPAVMGLAVTQIDVLVDLILATTLREGSVTALRLGNRMAIQPVGIFSVAIATVTLPTLSAYAARDERAKLTSDLLFSLRLTFTLMLPSTVLLISLARPLVRLLFERGEFTSSVSTPMTARALGYYAIGLFAYGGIKVIVQGFYSLKDTRTPVKIGTLMVALNIILNLILVRYLEHAGLALATSLSSGIGFIIMMLVLRKRLDGLSLKDIIECIGRVGVASLGMGVVIYYVSHSLEGFAQTLLGKAIQVGVTIIAGGISFILLSVILHAGEIRFLLSLLKQRKA